MYLASSSPRRRELLARAGFELVVCPADVDETRADGETPTELVARLATSKAHAACARIGALKPAEVLLAADTIVWTGEDVLGKPADADDAHRMLAALSGHTHHVSTGVCLLVGMQDGPARERVFVETTAVTFYDLSDSEIAAYVATGEPQDKAGAYGIQDRAATFVRGIEGDYANVVGLPVGRVVRELASLLPEGENLPARLMARATA